MYLPCETGYVPEFGPTAGYVGVMGIAYDVDHLEISKAKNQLQSTTIAP